MKPTPNEMPEEPSTLPESVPAELAAFIGGCDEDIGFSDIPETEDEDWVGAVRGRFYRLDRQVAREAD